MSHEIKTYHSGNDEGLRLHSVTFQLVRSFGENPGDNWSDNGCRPSPVSTYPTGRHAFLPARLWRVHVSLSTTPLSLLRTPQACTAMYRPVCIYEAGREITHVAVRPLKSKHYQSVCRQSINCSKVGMSVGLFIYIHICTRHPRGIYPPHFRRLSRKL